jgi:hypothetical protein
MATKELHCQVHSQGPLHLGKPTAFLLYASRSILCRKVTSHKCRPHSAGHLSVLNCPLSHTPAGDSATLCPVTSESQTTVKIMLFWGDKNGGSEQPRKPGWREPPSLQGIQSKFPFETFLPSQPGIQGWSNA